MHSASGYLVLAMIAPGKKVTLDSFMDRLYEHFRIVIAPAQYRRAIEDGSWKSSKDMADCFEINGRCFQDFLKQGTVKYYAQIHLQVWQNSVCTGQGNLPLIT